MNPRNPDLDDPLHDLFNEAANTATPRPAARVPADFVPAAERGFSERCPRCAGSGRFGKYGKCYKCNGTGQISFKTAPERRATNTANRRLRKDEQRQQWAREYKAEMDWLVETARRHTETQSGFTFPQNMLDVVIKYGGLTDNQLAAVRKLMARDAIRADQRAATMAARQAAAPTMDVTKLEAAFRTARESAARDNEGLKFLHLRLDTFVLTPAGMHSRNPGAIYVKEDQIYLGKVQEGRFFRSRDCSDEQERRIAVAVADPAAAAKAYGLRTGECSICGRELTNRESIDRGIGPVCAARWGF